MVCASPTSAEDSGVPLNLADCSSTDASRRFSGIMAGPSTTTLWWAYQRPAPVRSQLSRAQVGAAPSPGPAAWYTRQDWLQVSVAGGFEIRSVYDPGLCLAAPGTAAGTQLTAAPCTGGPTQTFLYLGTTTAQGRLWWLRATTPAKMCVAVGSVSGTDGLRLLLQPCSSSRADEAWAGPSY